MKDKLSKIIEYGLYLLVFLLPLQTRLIIKAGSLNGYWEYGTYSLYATDILLIILLLLFTLQLFFIRKIQDTRNKIQNHWWVIAGLELFVFISIFFASDKLLAVYKYGWFLLGVGMFWLITKASFNKLKLAYCLLAGLFLQAVLGIWQFLIQSNFSNKWLGIASHNPADLGVSVIETLTGGRWLRAYGGLDHPNILGGVLAIGILLVIFLILNLKHSLEITNDKLSRRCGTPPARWQIKNKYQIIKFLQILSGYFLLLTFITCLFFTFSRGAWIGAALGATVMLVIFIFKKDLVAQKNLIKVILAASILLFVLFSQFQDLALTRLSQDARLEVKSNTERIESYLTAKQIIKKNWLFGAGMGNYTLAVHNQLDNKQPSYNYQPAHNVFVLVFAEIGIIGLLFFVMLLVLLISNFQFPISKQFLITKFPIVFSVIIMMLFDHWWWSTHFGVLLFWLFVGLVFVGLNLQTPRLDK